MKDYLSHTPWYSTIEYHWPLSSNIKFLFYLFFFNFLYLLLHNKCIDLPVTNKSNPCNNKDKKKNKNGKDALRYL